MSWYTVMRTVAQGGDLDAQLEREANPQRSVIVARGAARRRLRASHFPDDEAERVRRWLDEEML